jgi:hypothetical protein
MQDPGYKLPRNRLLGTSVNKPPVSALGLAAWHHCSWCVVLGVKDCREDALCRLWFPVMGCIGPTFSP